MTRSWLKASVFLCLPNSMKAEAGLLYCFFLFEKRMAVAGEYELNFPYFIGFQL